MMNNDNTDQNKSPSGVEPVDESWALALLNESMLEDSEQDSASQGAITLCTASSTSPSQGRTYSNENDPSFNEIEDELAREAIVVSDEPSAIEKQQLEFRRRAEIKAEQERLAARNTKSWFAKLSFKPS